MTVDEFSKAIKMCSTTVRKLIREGKIYAMKPGLRQYRIPITEIERFNIMCMYKVEK